MTQPAIVKNPFARLIERDGLQPQCTSRALIIDPLVNGIGDSCWGGKHQHVLGQPMRTSSVVWPHVSRSTPQACGIHSVLSNVNCSRYKRFTLRRKKVETGDKVMKTTG